MNGSPWLPHHEEVLRSFAGWCSDAVIGAVTGHKAITIRKRRTAAGLPAYHPGRDIYRYGTWEELSDSAKKAIALATAER